MWIFDTAQRSRQEDEAARARSKNSKLAVSLKARPVKIKSRSSTLNATPVRAPTSREMEGLREEATQLEGIGASFDRWVLEKHTDWPDRLKSNRLLSLRQAYVQLIDQEKMNEPTAQYWMRTLVNREPTPTRDGFASIPLIGGLAPDPPKSVLELYDFGAGTLVLLVKLAQQLSADPYFSKQIKVFEQRHEDESIMRYILTSLHTACVGDNKNLPPFDKLYSKFDEVLGSKADLVFKLIGSKETSGVLN